MTMYTCLKLHASISLTANTRTLIYKNRNENFYFPYILFVDSVGFLLNNGQWNKLLSSFESLFSVLNDFELFLPFLSIHRDEHILKTVQNITVNIFGNATDCHYGNTECVWHLVFPLFFVAIAMKPWILTPFPNSIKIKSVSAPKKEREPVLLMHKIQYFLTLGHRWHETHFAEL